MSVNRREKRQQLRFEHKAKRKINWPDILKATKLIVLFYLLILPFIFGIIWYSIEVHNNTRRRVAANPMNMIAVVNKIYNTRREGHYATFSFIVNKRTFEGRTFDKYNGFTGDSVAIVYNKLQPSINMLYADATEETFKKAVLKPLGYMIIIGIPLTLIFTALVILFKILTGDRKVLEEMTTKVN